MADASEAGCPVCGAQAMETVHDSKTGTSLSSLCQILPGAKIVRFCHACGHMAGNGVADTQSFYETDYRILIEDEDEDQIYETRDDRIVTRTDHQKALVLDKVTLDTGSHVLDYGCAKAAMARKLLDARPDLKMHLFDVSHMYENFWDRLVPKDRQAVHRTPEAWNGRFDLITSFFAFEHIDDPAGAMAHVARLLKPGGHLHMIVPDVFGNAADFIVIDHVNHFTRPSLMRLLADAGLGEAEIDRTSYRGALVVTARKTGVTSSQATVTEDVSSIAQNARALSAFWTAAAAAIADSEDDGNTAAIYGSGFYGAFIYAHLLRPGAVAGFVDRSPWLQGKKLFGVPILAPEALPEDVNIVYAGLNPAIAPGIIEAQPWFGRDGLRIVYLQ